MIAFFRRIRQQLIVKNKVSRYILYAIGEIVLVVIGILIALQVNTWNQNRIRSQEELTLLKSIKNGLEVDQSDLLYNANRIESSIGSANRVIHALENDLAYTDSIAYFMGDLMLPVMFAHSTSAFETLKSKGIDLISNPELREELISVYDAGYKFFLNYEEITLNEAERGIKEIFPSRFQEGYVYDFSESNFKPGLTPLNFNALKSDHEFLYYIKTYKNRLGVLLDFHYQMRLLVSVENLISSVNKEIESLQQ